MSGGLFPRTVFVLRPELPVLSGARVHHRMLKGGINYSWTVMIKGCAGLYAFLWNKPSHYSIKYLFVF